MHKCVNVKVMELLYLCSIILGAIASASVEFTEEWHLWKAQHGKRYWSLDEEIVRHKVWLANRDYINTHNQNANRHGYSLAMNHHGDLTDEQFAEQYLTYSRSQISSGRDRLTQYQPPVGKVRDSLPEEVDWRKVGAVTHVQDQGWCGSSYAFSAVGAIEGAWALQRGTLRNLSAQNIVDCSVKYGNLGCLGGNMYTAYEYVHKNSGVDDTSYYPYTGRDSSCAFVREGVNVMINGSRIIEQGNEEDLQIAVAYEGPISVAVDASSSSFRFYQKGIYNAPTCSQMKVNHAMLIVGYGNYTYQDYWIVKNSWSEYWGMDGYIHMTRNMYNQCGIATDASYPTITKLNS